VLLWADPVDPILGAILAPDGTLDDVTAAWPKARLRAP
jgi:hypothetical protein